MPASSRVKPMVSYPRENFSSPPSFWSMALRSPQYFSQRYERWSRCWFSVPSNMQIPIPSVVMGGYWKLSNRFFGSLIGLISAP